jgi:hypothetical protein
MIIYAGRDGLQGILRACPTNLVQTGDEGRIATVNVLLTADRDFREANTIHTGRGVRRAITICVATYGDSWVAPAVETVGRDLRAVIVFLA